MSSEVVRVLILKSGAPRQSKAPFWEFRANKSSDDKICYLYLYIYIYLSLYIYIYIYARQQAARP